MISLHSRENVICDNAHDVVHTSIPQINYCMQMMMMMMMSDEATRFIWWKCLPMSRISTNRHRMMTERGIWITLETQNNFRLMALQVHFDVLVCVCVCCDAVYVPMLICIIVQYNSVDVIIANMRPDEQRAWRFVNEYEISSTFWHSIILCVVRSQNTTQAHTNSGLTLSYTAFRRLSACGPSPHQQRHHAMH